MAFTKEKRLRQFTLIKASWQRPKVYPVITLFQLWLFS